MVWKLWDSLLDGLAVLSAIVTGLMILGVCLDVFLRYMRLGGLAWVFDFVEFGLLFVTAAMAAYIARMSRHVEVDIVLILVPERVAKAMRVVSGILMVGVSFTLAFYAFRATLQSFHHGSFIFRYVLIPEWLPFAAIAIMFLSLGIEGMRRLHERIRTPINTAASRTDAF